MLNRLDGNGVDTIAKHSAIKILDFYSKFESGAVEADGSGIQKYCTAYRVAASKTMAWLDPVCFLSIAMVCLLRYKNDVQKFYFTTNTTTLDLMH
jgi:hypothetical protein